jgi:PAS domain S-box-containing protein
MRKQVKRMEPDIDRFYRTLAHDAPDAIIYADAEGVIRFWNRAAERLFGFSAGEALGNTLDIIIPESLRNRHWAGYRHMVQSGKSRYGAGDVLAVPALRKDGARRSVEFTILPFRDREGRTLGMAATVRDVTKRFAENKALREAAAKRKSGRRPGGRTGVRARYAGRNSPRICSAARSRIVTSWPFMAISPSFLSSASMRLTCGPLRPMRSPMPSCDSGMTKDVSEAPPTA